MVVFEKCPEDFNPKFEVAACIIEHNNEILMLHRQDHKPQGNTWGFPAGKRELDEDIFDTVKREIMEEINYEINPNFFRKVFVRFPEMDFVYHIYHQKIDNKFIPDLNLEEHKDFQWIAPADALKINLIQDEAPCLKMFLESRDEM